jgi:hypothetical protein
VQPYLRIGPAIFVALAERQLQLRSREPERQRHFGWREAGAGVAFAWLYLRRALRWNEAAAFALVLAAAVIANVPT